jgi:LacI family transcriptional regulator, gluconate utilization system Gnt-I transcriptional repressor
MPRQRGSLRHVRMADIATRAGVSMITVSRVLYKPGKVAPATRQRVQAIIDETGYVPNLIAGSLASNRSHVIAAIVPTLRNPVFGRTVHEVSEILRTHGYHLLLGRSTFSPAEEEALVTTFLARRPDAVFLHSTRHTEGAKRILLNARIPIVETGDLVKPGLDMVVSYSNYDAGKAMTNYLVTRGYRRIAFVSAPKKQNDRAMQRWRGYRRALVHHGLRYEADLVLEVALGLREGAEAIVELVHRRSPAQAVFFAGDVWAVGALLECHRRGWEVPGKVGIAGFDDQEMATESIPPLTTIRVPREEIGRRAGQMLVDRLDGKPVEPRRVDVGFSLIERGSA